MPGRRTQFRPEGGGGGGGGTTGNLRWGPQFGNNEKTSFGAVGSISLAEYRAIVAYTLTAQESITLIGAIQAQFNLTAQEVISIYFTLVFLYTEVVQGSISMSALVEAAQLVAQGRISISALQTAYGLTEQQAINLQSVALSGSLTAQGAISISSLREIGLLVESVVITMPALSLAGGLTAQESLTIFFTLTFLYLLIAQGSISMSALREIGQLVEQTVVTGSFSPGYTLVSADIIRMTALALVGLLQLQGSINMTAVQIGSLQTFVAGMMSGSLAPGYTMVVAGAIRMTALSLIGMLQAAGTLTGQLSVDYLRQLLAIGPTTGLAGRYDATQIAQADNSSIVTWADISGTGNSLSQGFPTSQPTFRTNRINSLPDAAFDGGDALRANAATMNGTNGSIFAVCTPTNAGTNAVFSSADEATATRLIEMSLSVISGVTGPRELRILMTQRNNDTTDLCYGHTPIELGQRVVVEWHSDGAAYELVVNGITQTLTFLFGSNTGDWFGDTTARDNFTMGALTTLSGTTDLFNGEIAEALVFDAVSLTAQNKLDWRNYLAQKWSVPGVSGVTGWGWNPIASVKIGSLAADYSDEQVAAAMEIPALAEVGVLQSAGSINFFPNGERAFLASSGALGAVTYVVTFNRAAGTFTLVVPNGVTALKSECWAGGGGGGTASINGGGAGAGGNYMRTNASTVAAADSLTILVGAASAGMSDGNPSSVKRGATTFCLANGGQFGKGGGAGGQGAGGLQGAVGTGDVSHLGGIGGGGGGVALNGGGGGGSGGDTTAGSVGAPGGSAGAGGTVGGANGGVGANGSTAAPAPPAPGGGGGGASTLAANASGARGQVTLTMVAA